MLFCRFWNRQKRKSPTAAVLWPPLVTWSPSKLRNECGCWGRGAGGQCHSCFCFRLLHRTDRPSFVLPIQKIYSLLHDGSKQFGCFVHRDKLMTSPWKPQVFCTHFAASLCHTWLFNQEKCNNTATYAQECLVWSCAHFVFLFHIFVHLFSAHSLAVDEYWWL